VTTSLGVTFSVRSARVKNGGGRGVPVRREQHVDDLTVLVEGLVHVAPHGVDPDVRLVDIPTVAR
jgi:hypothetical protein